MSRGPTLSVNRKTWNRVVFSILGKRWNMTSTDADSVIVSSNIVISQCLVCLAMLPVRHCLVVPANWLVRKLTATGHQTMHWRRKKGGIWESYRQGWKLKAIKWVLILVPCPPKSEVEHGWNQFRMSDWIFCVFWVWPGRPKEGWKFFEIATDSLMFMGTSSKVVRSCQYLRYGCPEQRIEALHLRILWLVFVDE